MRKDLEVKIANSIERLKLAAEISSRYYDQPMQVNYSGGKDSEVILHLAIEAGVPFTAVNAHTTADAPETVYHIRKVFTELKEMGYACEIKYPKYKGEPTSMWKLIPIKKSLPTRLMRYCCAILKEPSGKNRVNILGVRADEPSKRSTYEVWSNYSPGMHKEYQRKWSQDHAEEVFATAKQISEESGKDLRERDVWDCQMVTLAKKQKKLTCNAILEWTDEDVWDYIHEREIEYNPLYDEGWSRVGCIGCPVAGKHRIEEFERWPVYYENYKRAARRLMDAYPQQAEFHNNSVDEMMDWWLQGAKVKKG